GLTPYGLIGAAQVEVCLSEIRRNGHRAFERAGRIVVAVEVQVTLAERLERLRKVRADLCGLLKIAQSLLHSVLFQSQRTKVISCNEIRGVQFQRVLKRGARGLQVTGFGLGQSQVITGVSVLGVQFKGGLEPLDGPWIILKPVVFEGL